MGTSIYQTQAFCPRGDEMGTLGEGSKTRECGRYKTDHQKQQEEAGLVLKEDKNSWLNVDSEAPLQCYNTQRIIFNVPDLVVCNTTDVCGFYMKMGRKGDSTRARKCINVALCPLQPEGTNGVWVNEWTNSENITSIKYC